MATAGGRSDVRGHPGQRLVDGRYRLVACRGGDPDGRCWFWHAHDELLGRDVALTALPGDPARPADLAAADRLRERAGRWQALGSSALPPLFDLVCAPDADLGAAGLVGVLVTGWSGGTALEEVVRFGPIPAERACRMMRPLLAALDRAHEAGQPLGLDAVNLLRVDDRDVAVLTFAAPRAAASRAAEVRVAAAALSLLLTGAAEGTGTFAAAAPERIRALHSALRAASTEDTATCGPLRQAVDAIAESGIERSPAPRDVRADPAPHPAPAPVTRRSRAAVAAALLAVSAILTWTLVELGKSGQTAPPDATAPDMPAIVAPSAGARVTAVVPVRLAGYVVTGVPDNPDALANVLRDGSTRSWSTDRYAQQLPAYRPGVGILAEFDPAIEPVSVGIDSPSAGTVVEIRTAGAPGEPLSATDLLATATLVPGRTDIRLPPSPPTRLLLIWIVHLAGGHGAYQSTIDHIDYWSARL